MKSKLNFLCLFLFILWINSGKALAQCSPIIGINPPSLQNGYLILSGFGVNSTAFAEFWGEVNPDNTQWAALQNTIVPNPCTGWIFAYQIDIRTLNYGQVIQFRVKMFDSTLYSSDKVTYRVIHKRHHDAIDRIISGNNPNFNSYQYERPIIINSTSNSNEATNLDISQLTSSEFPSLIDIGEYDLERISNSDSQIILENIEVTVHEPSILISNHENYVIGAALYTMDGREVLNSKNEIFGNSYINLNIENLPAGIYILNINSSTGGMKSKKVMIH
ncbi:MAG: T9SS type A sorting domain-containing protein [Bacteroidetes bacterium]|nr:T9SS type A sorting domain-containing protein [Bacteroidota bacterium]